MIRQVEPLCKLLIHSRETLTSVEFIHCKLSSSFLGAICASLHEKDIHTNGIQRFCIKSSSIDIDPLAAPSDFISFLTSVRYTYAKVSLWSLWSFGCQSLFCWQTLSFLVHFSVFLTEHFFFFLSGPYVPYIFAIATSIGILWGWFSLHFLILPQIFRLLTSLKTMWVPSWLFLFKMIYGLLSMADQQTIFRFQDGFLLSAGDPLLVLCHLESFYGGCASST